MVPKKIKERKMIKFLYQYLLILQSGFFDRSYYLYHYPDVRRADIDGLMHFIKIGWKENRNPSEKFNTSYYLENNPDVKIANLNPLVHYIKHGKKEGRPPSVNAKIIKPIDRKTFGFLNLDLETKQRKDFEISGRIAIHLHIYYDNLIDEFITYLNNMPYIYDLFISVTSEKALNLCIEKFSGLPFLSKLTVKKVTNRGRDMAPFFCTFGEQIKNYQYIAHLHSKKSIYNQGATQGWREYLCGTLFRSSDSIKTIIHILQEDNGIGLIYPQTFYLVPYFAHTWLSNKHLGQIWCNRLGIVDIPSGYFDFPVGSMFWAKGDALAPLFESGIQLKDFEIENGQTDGTLAHALERLIGLCASKQNFEHGIIEDSIHPSWSPWRFDQYFKNSVDLLKEHLQSQQIKIIGFDLFDTLIIRPLLEPETIKRIVSQRSDPEIGKQYLKLRPLAESQARQEKKADVNLDEIYEQLAKISNISEKDLNKLWTLEQQIEMNIARPRLDGLKLFREAIASGVHTIIISDTFLKKDFLEDLLQKNDIKNYQALFISNDIGLRKDSGKLFDHILDKYSISPKNLLMIGDNEHSDLQLPMNKGIPTIHLMKPVEIAHGLPRFKNFIDCYNRNGEINDEITLGLAIQKKIPQIDIQKAKSNGIVKMTPFEIGYVYNGPFLLGFSQWLIEQSKIDSIDHLYFLSREGKIMKKVFDVWSQDIIDAPKSSYLELSRRAISVATITDIEDIYKIAKKIYFRNKLVKFLHTRFGIELDDEEWNIIEKELNFSRNSEIEIYDGDIIEITPLLNYLYHKILKRAHFELPALKKYLIESGLYENKKIAVVDIGFSGTIQGHLNKLLPKKVDGYYLMTAEDSKKIAVKYNVKTKGCFGENLSQSPDAPILYRHSFSVEKLLSCNDPQINYFKISEDNKLMKIYRELSTDEMEPINIRNQIHQGTESYAKEAVEIRNTIYPDFYPSLSVAKSLYESLIGNNNEADNVEMILNNLVLDDYYCGRDLVY